MIESSLAPRIRAYIAAMPPAISGPGGHTALLLAARALVIGFALSFDAAWPFITEFSERCEPPWSPRELEHKLKQATANKMGLQLGYLLDCAPLPDPAVRSQPVIEEEAKYDAGYLEEKASAITETIDEAYLEARSQFTCWNRSPAGFLHKLYRQGEHVWITDRYNSRHGEIWTHNGLEQRFDELDHYLTGHDGVWYLTAPIDGRLHAVGRVRSEWNPEGYSFTVLETLAAWLYLLIETDVAPIHFWRKTVVQWNRPIVAIYESGDLGDHVLLRVNAQSKEDFDRIAKQYDRDLIRLGACPGSVTARRLSRLPNCMRGQTGRLQRLLYLRPDADGTPICQIPPP
jgi:hypothetical protein